MDPIRPATTLPPTATIETARAGERPVGGLESDRKSLDPAVSIDLSTDAVPGGSKADRAEAERRGYERDAETRALVYRVTDASTGEVVVQIPNEVVIKARAYLREPNAPAGERVVKSV